MTHDLAAAVDVTDAMALGNPQALLSVRDCPRRGAWTLLPPGRRAKDRRLADRLGEPVRAPSEKRTRNDETSRWRVDPAVDVARAGALLDLGLPVVPGLRPADVAGDVGGAGRRLLSRPGEPPAHPLQHDPVQLVRGRAHPASGADRAADAPD